MSTETSQWLDDFRRRRGRPLRVLHIGNIANNAYRNALIQRRIGIDAYVVCYDYYHIMGCPEWEEADLGGEYDAFLPDWWTIDAGDWRRPAWFIQGSLKLCLAYLRALHTSSRGYVQKARLALIQNYAALLDASPASSNAQVRDIMAGRNRWTTERLAPELRRTKTAGPFAIFARACDSAEQAFAKFSSPQWRASLAEQTASGLLDPALRLSRAKTPLRRPDRFKLTVYSGVRKLLGQASAPIRQPASPGYWEPDPSTRGYARLVFRYLAGTTLWMGLQCFAAAGKWWRGQVSVVPSKPVVALAGDAEINRLAASYHAANADIATDRCNEDLQGARAAAAEWRDIFAYYDIVQGYSVDAALPLFAGHPNFIAYEHGTIRDIPFEISTRGRLCRFTYANVPRALITNTDVLPSADRIPIEPSRRIYLPHAFDDSRLKAFRRDNQHLKPSGDTVQLFSPSRHDWFTPDRSLNKGNDILLRGVAEAVRTGVKVRIKLVEWGQHIKESKRLIDDLGISDLVSWVPIMNRAQLWSACLTSHAVADQFALPALGGVGYESLTLGARLITNLDAPVLAEFFGEAPPVLMAATSAEVADRVRELAADLQDQAGRGRAGAAWAARYHSTARILDLQVSAYREMLEGLGRSTIMAGAEA
jgi:glycosyltransferase involved in cell wall biosynthesis